MRALIQRLNTCRCWQSRWNVYGAGVFAPTLDRALYLFLHKIRFAGGAEKLLLEGLARPGDIVLDIGANVGLYTAVLANSVGRDGRVIAFEPMPAMADAVRRMVEWNRLSCVEVHQLALGETDGCVNMAVPAFNSGDTRVSDRGSIPVPVRRGDSLLANLPSVQLIKIDVQGYELPALRGLEQLLLRSPGVRIVFEYWPRGMELAGYPADQLTAYLIRMDFDLFRIGPGSRLRPLPWGQIQRHLVSRPWGECQNFVAAKRA